MERKQNESTITLNNRHKTDAIYIDFQKAFDSVSHPKLLTKRSSYKITGDMFACIAGFLTIKHNGLSIINNCLYNNIHITRSYTS